MLERFVKQTKFTSQEDFIKNLKIEVPENFNFGYDVVDAWAAEQPEKKAILWTNDQGAEHQYTYAELKEKLKVLEDKECKVVVYLDACYAGEMYYTKAANEFIADADPAVIGFYSSTRNEPSLEKKALGHGVFTYALLNGLKGGAKDSNDNVTITSLGDYIAEQVRIETDGRQTPKVDNGGEDFILFRASNLPIDVSSRVSAAVASAGGERVSAADEEIMALAASYYSGSVVPPTAERAFEAYTAAANAGDVKSMYMLGVWDMLDRLSGKN